MHPQPAPERHCTHCGGALEYRGLKELHEGFFLSVTLRKMGVEAYICRACGHVEFFYPSEYLSQ